MLDPAFPCLTVPEDVPDMPRLIAVDAKESPLPLAMDARESPRLESLVGLEVGFSGDARLDIFDMISNDHLAQMLGNTAEL